MNCSTPRRSVMLMMVLIMISSGVAGCSRFMFRSEAEIRGEVLTATPLGSQLGDVERFIATRRLRVVSRVLGGPERELYIPIRIKAAGYVHATLAEYYSPRQTTIAVYWFLDQEGKLKEVYVRRSTDAP